MLLTAPNIIGYGRVGLLGLALASGTQAPRRTLSLFFLNFVLDGVDGAVARRLHQETDFGALLDVLIDISSRAVLWSWAITGPLALVPVLLEAFTFVCTYKAGGAGWKAGGCFAEAPYLIRAVMNFKSPAGIFCITGLMGCPMWAMAIRHMPRSAWSAAWLGALLISGRCLTAVVELWAIATYMQALIHTDLPSKDAAAH